MVVSAQSRPKAKPIHLTPLAMVLIGGGVGVLILLIPLLILLAIFLGTYFSANVLPGVTLAGKGINPVSIGGMSPTKLTVQLNTINVNAPITLRDGQRTWQFSAADLGVKIDVPATVDKASKAGRSDPLTAIGVMIGGTQVEPVYTLDMIKAQATLSALTTTISDKPTDDPIVTRRVLNVDATLDHFPPDLAHLFANPNIDLVLDQQQGPRTTYTVQRGEELGLISKKFNVAVSDIVALNHLQNADQIYPGQQLTIPAAGIWQPTDKDAPPAPLTSGKAIVVSLAAQRIYAYQDGHLVHSSLMSSGLPGHETLLGDYHIYVKYVTTRMTGPDYDIPDVPWTMYFYQGYGIHGAYWHNDFGREMSHGCVNLDTTEAKWFYDFAPIGTLVRVLSA